MICCRRSTPILFARLCVLLSVRTAYPKETEVRIQEQFFDLFTARLMLLITVTASTFRVDQLSSQLSKGQLKIVCQSPINVTYIAPDLFFVHFPIIQWKELEMGPAIGGPRPPTFVMFMQISHITKDSTSVFKATYNRDQVAVKRLKERQPYDVQALLQDFKVEASIIAYGLDEFGFFFSRYFADERVSRLSFALFSVQEPKPPEPGQTRRHLLASESRAGVRICSPRRLVLVHQIASCLRCVLVLHSFCCQMFC